MQGRLFRSSVFQRLFNSFMAGVLAFTLIAPGYAQGISLPEPGVMIHLSPGFNPPTLKGIKVSPDDPFRFDFILDQGDSLAVGEVHEPPLRESERLIKYFMASLTIPEKDLWVNLSPYEKDRIIPQSFGLTEMGRDLLAEDYILKQITGSLIYPEEETGKKFWKRVYEQAALKFGRTDIQVDTFNKVWIMPESAVVYEDINAGAAYVVESKLKVLLDQDYLALGKNAEKTGARDINPLGAQVIREIVIPELTKEVNEGRNFSRLRQVYHSLILAFWYKKKIQDSILKQVYEDKNKIGGIQVDDSLVSQKIYERYVQAFNKGVFNYIKEDDGPGKQEAVPRKYFSGGARFDDAAMSGALRIGPFPAPFPMMRDNSMIVEVRLNRSDQAMLPAEFSAQSLEDQWAGLVDLLKKKFPGNPEVESRTGRMHFSGLTEQQRNYVKVLTGGPETMRALYFALSREDTEPFLEKTASHFLEMLQDQIEQALLHGPAIIEEGLFTEEMVEYLAQDLSRQDSQAFQYRIWNMGRRMAQDWLAQKEGYDGSYGLNELSLASIIESWGRELFPLRDNFPEFMDYLWKKGQPDLKDREQNVHLNELRRIIAQVSGIDEHGFLFFSGRRDLLWFLMDHDKGFVGLNIHISDATTGEKRSVQFIDSRMREFRTLKVLAHEAAHAQQRDLKLYSTELGRTMIEGFQIYREYHIILLASQISGETGDYVRSLITRAYRGLSVVDPRKPLDPGLPVADQLWEVLNRANSYLLEKRFVGYLVKALGIDPADRGKISEYPPLLKYYQEGLEAPLREVLGKDRFDALSDLVNNMPLYYISKDEKSARAGNYILAIHLILANKGVAVDSGARLKDFREMFFVLSKKFRDASLEWRRLGDRGNPEALFNSLKNLALSYVQNTMTREALLAGMERLLTDKAMIRAELTSIVNLSVGGGLAKDAAMVDAPRLFFLFRNMSIEEFVEKFNFLIDDDFFMAQGLYGIKVEVDESQEEVVEFKGVWDNEMHFIVNDGLKTPLRLCEEIEKVMLERYGSDLKRREDWDHLKRTAIWEMTLDSLLADVKIVVSWGILGVMLVYAFHDIQETRSRATRGDQGRAPLVLKTNVSSSTNTPGHKPPELINQVDRAMGSALDNPKFTGSRDYLFKEGPVHVVQSRSDIQVLIDWVVRGRWAMAVDFLKNRPMDLKEFEEGRNFLVAAVYKVMEQQQTDDIQIEDVARQAAFISFQNGLLNFLLEVINSPDISQEIRMSLEQVQGLVFDAIDRQDERSRDEYLSGRGDDVQSISNEVGRFAVELIAGSADPEKTMGIVERFREYVQFSDQPREWGAWNDEILKAGLLRFFEQLQRSDLREKEERRLGVLFVLCLMGDQFGRGSSSELVEMIMDALSGLQDGETGAFFGKKRSLIEKLVKFGAGYLKLPAVPYLNTLKEEVLNAEEIFDLRQEFGLGNHSAQQGGIDLTTKEFLRVKNNGENGSRLKIGPVSLEQFQDFNGFSPEILGIKPLKDLPQFLGMQSSP